MLPQLSLCLLQTFYFMLLWVVNKTIQTPFLMTIKAEIVMLFEMGKTVLVVFSGLCFEEEVFLELVFEGENGEVFWEVLQGRG